MESPIIAKLPRGHRMDRQFGVVYEDIPARADDLTRIEGIRTREAVLLNQRGIYLFGQVALWRHKEMVEIAGDLHVSMARIVDESWVEQARKLSQSSPPVKESALPASVLRTLTFLVCALLIGFFTVYMLGGRRNSPLTGVLSADITAIHVPAPSRLTVVHVKQGQEVFSGQPLLTLERVEHLAMIEAQERKVRKLEMDLQQTEAQARMEVEMRTSEIDLSLANVRHQIARQTAEAQEPYQSSPATTSTARKGTAASPISARNSVDQPSNLSQPGSLAFFSRTGESTPAVLAKVLPSVPVRTAVVPREDVVCDSPATGENPPDSSALVAALQSEESRLRALSDSLRTTVREATGAAALKDQLDEAARHLDDMKSMSQEILVKAPVYGVVGQIRFRQGDDLPNGEIMLRILHTDRRYIKVHLPTRRIHEMEAGQEVELVFPCDQNFRGRVIDVPMLADAVNQSGDSVTTVRIEPIGKLWPMIPVGSQVDVISAKRQE